MHATHPEEATILTGRSALSQISLDVSVQNLLLLLACPTVAAHCK